MWKLIFDTLKSFILVISAMIPILGFIGIDNYDTLLSRFQSSRFYRCVIFISILLFILMSLGEYALKSKKLQIRSDALHKIFHDIRNFSYNSTYTNDSFQKTVENICNYFDKISSHKFHVCIKTFDFGNNNICQKKDDIEELHVKTFVRAGSNMKKRQISNQAIHKVIDNTDFSSILFDNNSNIYSCSNLLLHDLIGKILSPSQQYKNSDPNYFWKYLADIVIPIRIENQFLTQKPNDKGVSYNNYITIGFLCIDCRTPISRALRKEINGVGSAFADALFEPLYKHINP